MADPADEVMHMLTTAHPPPPAHNIELSFHVSTYLTHDTEFELVSQQALRIADSGTRRRSYVTWTVKSRRSTSDGPPPETVTPICFFF